MIITKQLDFNALLNLIKNESVFIIGCNECATLCHTGGEKEIIEMKKRLEDKNINVTGWTILEPACHFLNDKKILKKNIEQINNANKILVLSCGNGIQTVSEIIRDKNIISGCNTIFLGEIKRLKKFEKRCSLCGECIQDLFESFCPISRCPKSMLNGPCGGSTNGKCEISTNIDCIWIDIYNKMKEKKLLDNLKTIREPKDWSKSLEMVRNI